MPFAKPTIRTDPSMPRDRVVIDDKARAVDWGKMGTDRTIITLTCGDTNPEKAAAKIADAIRWLQAEYPGCEVHVRGLDGRTWEPRT